MPPKLASWISTYGRIISWVMMAIVVVAGFIVTKELAPLISELKSIRSEIVSVRTEFEMKYVTRTQADELYMHKDVSEARWQANNDAHKDIKDGIGDIKNTLREMESRSYQRSSK
jgi:hypothetical protein